MAIPNKRLNVVDVFNALLQIVEGRNDSSC